MKYKAYIDNIEAKTGKTHYNIFASPILGPLVATFLDAP
jgi:hypothetical protein